MCAISGLSGVVSLRRCVVRGLCRLVVRGAGGKEGEFAGAMGTGRACVAPALPCDQSMLFEDREEALDCAGRDAGGAGYGDGAGVELPLRPLRCVAFKAAEPEVNGEAGCASMPQGDLLRGFRRPKPSAVLDRSALQAATSSRSAAIFWRNSRNSSSVSATRAKRIASCKLLAKEEGVMEGFMRQLFFEAASWKGPPRFLGSECFALQLLNILHRITAVPAKEVGFQLPGPLKPAKRHDGGFPSDRKAPAGDEFLFAVCCRVRFFHGFELLPVHSWSGGMRFKMPCVLQHSSDYL